MTEAPLQLTNGVGRAIGEEREHVRLALGETHIGQERLQPDACRMRRPLQFEDEKAVGRGDILSWAFRPRSRRHGHTVVRNGIVRQR